MTDKYLLRLSVLGIGIMGAWLATRLIFGMEDWHPIDFLTIGCVMLIMWHLVLITKNNKH
ncbi:hypothetical protein [Leucobacter sp. OH1287]|uniref:hypothetical protein n=1 Tax=Leucobacter sp. OH1287 TaxID=2491049 RepID=UPI000F5E6F01|nr:hypothetical protein [Leucobacter sp. OH1287]RRD61656.1 hypothetical protein EII30_02175 [Leucobacter sp. OH1287]